MNTPIPSPHQSLDQLPWLQARITELEAHVAQLNARENDLRQLADIMPMLIWISGPDASVLYFNQPWLDFTGRTLEQELGAGWTAGIHPDDADESLAIYRAAVEARRPYQHEYRLKSATGEYRWLLDTGRPYFQIDGTLGGYVGTCVDITERKQAEAALRQSEQRYRRLTENISDVIWTVNLNFQFTDVSPSITQLLGISADEAMTRSPLADLPPLSQAKIAQLMAEVGVPEGMLRLPRHWTHTLELENRHADGTLIPVEVKLSLLHDDQDQLIGLMGVTRDMRERKRAEAALRDSEALYHTLVETLPMNVFRKDAAGRFTFGNTLFCQTTGRPWADIAGKTDFEIHPPALAQKYRQDDEQVMGSARVFETIEDYQTIGSARRYVQTFKTALREADGRVGGIQGIFWDITARKQLEEALRQNEAYLRAIVDNSPFLVWLKDQAGRFLMVNQVFAQTCGRANADDLIGLTDLDVWPRDLAERYRADDEDVMRLRQPTAVVEPIVEHGAIKWFETFKTPILAETGQVLGTTGFARDITARQQMEQALRESEDRYRNLFENSPMGIYRTTPDGRILAANPALVQLLGYPTLDELQQRNLETDPKDVSGRAQFKAQIERDGWVVGRETEWQRRDGRRIDVRENARLIRAATGQPLYYDGTVEDVTARKQAEAALHESEAKLRALFNATDEAIALIEPSGRIIAANDTMSQRLRVSADLAGDNIFDLMPPPVAERRRAWARQVVDTGQPLRTEDDNQGHWLDTTVTPIFNADGRVTQLTIYVRDITARKQIEEALRQLTATLEQRVADRTRELADANRRLSELDRIKDEFVSRIGHELRTPLTSIKIYLELLETGKPEKREKYFQTLNREADRLQILIEDLLSVSRLSTADVELVCAAHDVNRLVNERLVIWGEQATRHGLELHTNLSPDLPPAYIDRELTTQVIGHLVHNAINYTPEGAITLTTATRSDETGRWVTISVRDTGPGIAPDELPHIFERFYRGRAAADYKTPGTGVGLSLSREIADKMGGRLTVETRVGVGSTFTVWLPLATDLTLNMLHSA